MRCRARGGRQGRGASGLAEDPAPLLLRPRSWRSDNDGPRRLAALLRDNLDRVPVHTRKRYYLERVVFPEDDEPVTEPVLDSPDLTSPSNEALGHLERTWHQMVGELDTVGYFDRRAGDRCTDGHPEAVDEHHATMAKLLSRRCGWPVAWPGPQPNVTKDWLEEELFTLIEVVHDLIARPRYRSWHDFEEDFHYHAFNERAGQAVYRWKVNTLLAIHSPGYRIATDGEDAGLIVTTVPDPRAKLEQAVRTDVLDGNSDNIGHAIALFRRRGAGVEDKRSACKALAAVLEYRRTLMRTSSTRWVGSPAAVAITRRWSRPVRPGWVCGPSRTAPTTPMGPRRSP